MAYKFTDVAKGAKDLLAKNYTFGSKAEVKTATPNGVIFTSEVAVADRKTSATIKADYKNGNFKVEKLTLNTDSKIEGEFSLAEAFPGVKLIFKATDGSRAKGADAISASFGVEAVRGPAFLTTELDAINQSLTQSITYSRNGALFGVNAKAGIFTAEKAKKALDAAKKAAADKKDGSSFDEKAFAASQAKLGSVLAEDFAVLLGYRAKTFTVGLQADKKLKQATAFYQQAVSADLTVAGTVVFEHPFPFLTVQKPKAASAAGADVEASKKQAGVPTALPFALELGGSYKLAADTTVYAKAGSSGKVTLAYAQQVSPLTKLTFSGELDAVDVTKDARFGVLLNIAQ